MLAQEKRQPPALAALHLLNVHGAEGSVCVRHARVDSQDMRVGGAGQRACVRAWHRGVLGLDHALHGAVPPAALSGLDSVEALKRALAPSEPGGALEEAQVSGGADSGSDARGRGGDAAAGGRDGVAREGTEPRSDRWGNGVAKNTRRVAPPLGQEGTGWPPLQQPQVGKRERGGLADVRRVTCPSAVAQAWVVVAVGAQRRRRHRRAEDARVALASTQVVEMASVRHNVRHAGASRVRDDFRRASEVKAEAWLRGHSEHADAPLRHAQAAGIHQRRVDGVASGAQLVAGELPLRRALGTRHVLEKHDGHAHQSEHLGGADSELVALVAGALVSGRGPALAGRRAVSQHNIGSAQSSGAAENAGDRHVERASARVVALEAQQCFRAVVDAQHNVEASGLEPQPTAPPAAEDASGAGSGAGGGAGLKQWSWCCVADAQHGASEFEQTASTCVAPSPLCKWAARAAARCVARPLPRGQRSSRRWGERVAARGAARPQPRGQRSPRRWGKRGGPPRGQRGGAPLGRRRADAVDRGGDVVRVATHMTLSVGDGAALG